MQRSIKKFELLHFCATQKQIYTYLQIRSEQKGLHVFLSTSTLQAHLLLAFPSANLAVEASLSLPQLVDHVRLRLAIVDSVVKFIFCHFHR